MRYTYIIILMLTLLSCAEDDTDNVNSYDLQGIWVDVESRTDTLSFESLDQRKIMYLSRGKELREGYLLPKNGSGPYEYKLTNGKISLYWMLSSNSSFNDYYFKIVDNQLTIGNFYGSEIGDRLTFEKQ